MDQMRSLRIGRHTYMVLLSCDKQGRSPAICKKYNRASAFFIFTRLHATKGGVGMDDRWIDAICTLNLVLLPIIILLNILFPLP